MMQLQPTTGSDQMRLLILAPGDAEVPPAFQNQQCDATRHEELLADMQRLRGSVYLEDGAIERGELSDDGRHSIGIDRDSWHLLATSASGEVCGCVRYRSYPPTAGFRNLWVGHSALASSPIWRRQFQAAGDLEFQKARHRNIAYVEVVGW